MTNPAPWALRLAICLPLVFSARSVHLRAQAPSIPKELIAELRGSRTATVIVLDGALEGPFDALCKSDALAEYGLQIVSPKVFGEGPLNRDWASSVMGPSDFWLVLDAWGQPVAKGRSLPSAAELKRKLAQGGVLPVEQYLRKFLKTHPGNLEARAALIGLLHEKAVAQTTKALKLEPETKEDRETSLTAAIWSGIASLIPTSTDKMLGDDLDVKTWAPFAQELETLFADPAWAAAPIALDGYLAEGHSKQVQVAYRRHIAKVQDALVSTPSSYQCWQLWVRLKSALPEKPLAAFVNELRPLPQELRGRNYLLDPRVVNLLLADARKHGEWDFVRELLLGQFDAEFPPETLVQDKESKENKDAQWEMMYRADSLDIYQNFIEPLIEALVSSGGERAVPDVLRRFRDKRGDVRDLDARLGNLAKRLGRADLAPSWMGE